MNDFSASMEIPVSQISLGVANPDLAQLVKDAVADTSVGGYPIAAKQKIAQLGETEDRSELLRRVQAILKRHASST